MNTSTADRDNDNDNDHHSHGHAWLMGMYQALITSDLPTEEVNLRIEHYAKEIGDHS